MFDIFRTMLVAATSAWRYPPSMAGSLLVIPALRPSLISGATGVLLCMLGSGLAALATSPVQAQWVQQHYGSADGLPVSSASSAQIDADGFLWLGTHDGLARFDGQRFDIYDSMRFPAMSGNRIRALYKDAEGRLFAHSEHGDWLSIRSGNIESAAPGGAKPRPVLYIDPASLCLTTAQALHCPDGSGEFPVRSAFPSGVSAQLALPGLDDSLWAVGNNGEIWLQRQGHWRALGELPKGSASYMATPALIADDGALWLGLQRHLTQVRLDGRIVSQDSPLEVAQLRKGTEGQLWVSAGDSIYRTTPGHALHRVGLHAEPADIGYAKSWQAPDGSLWLNRNGDLFRLDAGHAPDSPRPEPILRSSGAILDLLFGDDGTVWVMTLRDGIYRLNRARVALLDDTQGLGSSNVYGVSRDNAGTMWLGTLGDGLKAIDHQGQLHRYGMSEGLPGNNPWLVAVAPDNTIYVGTHAPGLWRRLHAEDRFVPVPLPDPLAHERVLAIVFDSHGQMWLGTTAGVWKQEVDNWSKQWPDGDAKVRVSALALSNENEHWFGGATGVWRQHGEAVHAVAPALLERASVRDLFLDTQGALWISTDGRGLVRVAANDPHGTHAVRLGRLEGLPSNSPHAVREDGNGHLWVNSNQGIFRIASTNLEAFLAGNTQRLSPLVLGLADGLTELEGNGGVQPAAAFDARGRLWFPSQRGVVRFDPLDMPLRKQAPRAVIDSLESDGRVLGAVSGTASLPAGVRSLLIRYGAADLHAGSQIRFRYRLLPQDQGWTDAANGRSVGFAHLAPGKHRFELLAGNSDGIWADTATTLDIQVPHHWYETRLFHLAALLTLGAAIFITLRWRVRHLQQRATTLDDQVRARTGELSEEKRRVETALAQLSDTHQALAHTHDAIEDRNQQLAEQARRLEALDRFRSRVLADVSHELRTPVMLVTLPLRELHAQARALTETDRRRLNLSLQQLDRLSALIEQLVGLVQAESGQIRLQLSRTDLATLLEEIVAGFQPMAEKVGATLVLQPAEKPLLLFGDRQQLITIFGNLIDNAIKYAPAGSRIRLRVERDAEHVHVEVQDQGPGFDQAQGTRLFERFYRVEGPPRHGREGLGIGLALARELVELHGGQISAHGAHGSGATFRVDLPLGSAHVAVDELSLERSEAHTAPPMTSAAKGNGRILLVEDHPDLAAYLAERLSDHLPVTCVANAEDAWVALSADEDIRLVVSDVVLPGESGLVLCKRLADATGTSPIPVILISAKAADSDRAAGMAAGASAYLAKPFSFEHLLQAITAAWPAAASTLTNHPVEADGADPLLKIALDGLPDAHFSITEWAERAHLSERQLRRRVNELAGQAPQTWLREQRLLRVRQLIRSGACRTLAEAGARSGMDNPAYLYRSYRARFGEQ